MLDTDYIGWNIVREKPSHLVYYSEIVFFVFVFDENNGENGTFSLCPPGQNFNLDIGSV